MKGPTRKTALGAIAVLVAIAVAAALVACQAQSVDSGDRSSASPEARDLAFSESGTSGSSDSQVEEEWSGQSLGYVGPNGEGAYTEDDWTTDEEYAAIMQDVYREEYDAPHIYRDDYEEGVLLVTFDRSYGELAAREVVEECGGEWVSSDFKRGVKEPKREIDRMATATVFFPNALDKDELELIAERLKGYPEVVRAELNSIGRSTDDATDMSESDESATDSTRSIQQYYIYQSGFSHAWDVVKCQGSVTVAVIDCGFSLDHPDLAANLLPGYDTTTQSVLTASYDDDGGHGTKVAGVVSAVAGNGIGIDGASYNANIVPIRHSTSGDSIPWENVRRALQYVYDHETSFDVVNMSFEFTSGNTDCEDLLGYLHDYGIVCVAASGNQRPGEAALDMVKYPAAYDGVISVASVDSSNMAAPDSNRNAYVDLCAPGVSVYTIANPLSTESLGLYYGICSGTSFAAPQVSAAAALLKAQNPDWDAQDIEDQLEGNVLDLGITGRDDVYGYGLIDVAAAVGWTPSGGSPNTGGSVAEMYMGSRR